MKQREPIHIPALSSVQLDLLQQLEKLASDFNQSVNLYSKASIDHFWDRHIMHSLTIASKRFPPGSAVADWGTGGGMPGLPLSIACPEVDFHLVDAVGKKIRAVRAISRRLGLDNVHAWHGRAESWPGEITHSVSRATSPLHTLWTWHRRAATPTADLPKPTTEGEWRPGLICLKGGDLSEEVSLLHRSDPTASVEVYPLEPILKQSYFESKSLISVSAR